MTVDRDLVLPGSPEGAIAMLLLAMERSKGATRLKKIKKMARCSCKIAVLAQFRGRSLASLHCHPGGLGTVDGIAQDCP